MRILVCGGREYNDYDTVDRILRQTTDKIVLYTYPKEITIIQGGARGADKLGKLWANIYNVNMEEYPADWKKFGKAAGVIRNKDMLLKGKPDLVVAFPGGKGTAHMVKIAKKNGVEVFEVE